MSGTQGAHGRAAAIARQAAPVLVVAAMLATGPTALAFTAKLDVQAEGRVMTGTLDCVPAGAVTGDITLGLPTTNQTGPQLAAGGRAAGKYQLTARVNGSFDAKAPDSIAGTADISGTFTGADGAVGATVLTVAL